MTFKAVLFGVLLYPFYMAGGQTPTISVTTSKPVGSQLRFEVSSLSDNTVVQVDFGDGILVNKTIHSYTSVIEGVVAGNKTVKWYAPTIVLFACAGQQVTSIDVSNSIVLNYLYCSYNQIGSLDVSNNTRLETLICMGNQIDKLDVRKNDRMILLACSYNQLDTLDVSNKPFLTTLECSYNALSYVDVTGDSQLMNIRCEHNNLTNLDLSRDSALKVLDCSNNQLTSLETGSARGLSELNCSANNIHSLNVTNNLLLSSLTCGNNQVSSLDVSQNTELINLGCGYNNISELDISNNTLLTTLNCSVNQINQIDFSHNPKLYYISCGYNRLTTLDVSNNYELRTLLAFDNLISVFKPGAIGSLQYLYLNDNQISHLEVSDNSGLLELNCGNNLLSDLDVRSNQVLNILICSDNKLNSLDLTGNTKLGSLSCENNLLTKLNLTGLKFLDVLNCSGNLLDTLILTTNHTLASLYCMNNNLIYLDISHNLVLKQMDCTLNRFKFTSLPVKQDISYNYAPQQDIPVPGELQMGEVMDLSDQLSVNEDTTQYTWKTTSGEVLIKDLHYRLKNGKTIFLFAPGDSVYCEMTNAAFPDFANTGGLKTGKIKIAGQNADLYMITSGDISSEISFCIQAEHDSTPVLIDFGDGQFIKDTLCDTLLTRIKGKLTGNDPVKIFGNGITHFICDSNRLTALNTQNDSALRELSCRYNNISSLNLSRNHALTRLNCEGNRLTICTLPLKDTLWNAYSYAPQQPVTIPKTIDAGKETDLSKFLYVSGYPTTYQWKTTKGEILKQDTDYVVLEGRTVFLLNPHDSVYCVMTNSIFPDFRDSFEFKTTNTNIIWQGENIILTTSHVTGYDLVFKFQAGEDSTSIQIDFGNGTPFKRIINSTPTTIKGKRNGYNPIRIFGKGITHFTCDSDKIITLDTENEPELEMLSCRYNNIDSLNLGYNENLKQLLCEGNQLNFSTLPLRKDGWTFYSYAPQIEVTIPQVLETGIELDLSRHYMVNGTGTVYLWQTIHHKPLLPDIDYTYENGKFVFTKALADSIFCEMTNTVFADFSGSNALKTTNIKIVPGIPTGSFEVGTPEICVFKHILQITCDNNTQLFVFAIDGRLIEGMNLAKGINRVPVSDGIYIIKLVNDGIVISKKLVIL
ncbi:MAG TPA: hypothetical protein VK179_15745 [Bacteroidales bacterium]|nr:hypothetical protein [Bacteroidales bacterium]